MFINIHNIEKITVSKVKEHVLGDGNLFMSQDLIIHSENERIEISLFGNKEQAFLKPTE